MSHHRLLGGLAATTLAIGGLALTTVPASAAATTDGLSIIVTPASGLLDTSQTRSTGHNDFLEHGLHVWTESNGSTDKAAGYINQATPLAGMAEPTLDWTPTGNGATGIPGRQLVVDFDHDGAPDGILVGEPAYGNEWWLSNSAASWVKASAPHNGGGYGSPWYGTIAEWASAFPGSITTQVGYSMGSGVWGDGVIDSMTYGDTTYTFALGVGPCQAIDDVSTQTYTLTQDCSTYETIGVDDGWTLDGAGFTIHAVEDGGHPNFPGPVVQSATGDDSGPATMNVENLTIQSQGFGNGNSGGTLSGIRYSRAGGSVSDVSIQGISHGNGVQEGIGLWVRNRDASGSTAVPAATISVDDLTVTRYQKGGVVLDGNLGFTMTDSTVGSAAAPDGTPLTSIAANAVQISRTAHGTLTGNHIGLNEYNPVPPPGDGSDATSILVYDAGTVSISDNVISGGNGDVGLDTYNDSTGAIDTVIDASCNLFSRSESGGDFDPYGVGIATWDDGSTPVDLTVSDSSFSGWNHDTSAISVDGDGNLVFEAGAPNQQLGGCAPSAPEGVTAPGGDRQTDVSWVPSSAPEYAPLTGYTASAIDGDGNVVASQDVGPNADSAHLTGLAEGEDYTIAVVAHGTGGDSAQGVTTLYATSLSVSPAKDVLVIGKSTVLNGVLSGGSGSLGGRSVTLQQAPAGSGAWTTFGTATTAADGSFSKHVSPSANTDYRAIYAGDPDLSGTSPTATIGVGPKVHVFVTKKNIKLNKKMTVTGNVSPFTVGEGVYLQQRGAGGVWTTIQTGSTASDGSFLFRSKETHRGNFVYRVTSDPDATHIAGRSHSFAVTVH